MSKHTPATDQKIAQRYSAKTLEKKRENKTSLQKEIGWPNEPKRPMLCLPAGMSQTLGGSLFEQVLPGIMSLPVELLVVGQGSSHYGKVFTDLSEENGHCITIIPAQEEAIRKMYAAADMALFCTDPAGSDELAHSLRYGVVPVAPQTKHLTDYNPVQESGNAFLYEKEDLWHCFAALVRAVETHKFPFDWRTIQRHCMESVA